MRHVRVAALRVLMVVVMLGLLARAWPAGTVSEINSLKGVHPLRVFVTKLRPDVTADGLSHDRLRLIISERLKQQGLPVDQNATNDLYLIVTTSPQTDGKYAVHLHLEGRQLVALFHEFIRDPESRDIAATWRASWIGIVKPDEFKQVEVALVQLVDKFIADWRIGNRGRPRTR